MLATHHACVAHLHDFKIMLLPLLCVPEAFPHGVVSFHVSRLIVTGSVAAFRLDHSLCECRHPQILRSRNAGLHDEGVTVVLPEAMPRLATCVRRDLASGQLAPNSRWHSGTHRLFAKEVCFNKRRHQRVGSHIEQRFALKSCRAKTFSSKVPATTRRCTSRANC